MKKILLTQGKVALVDDEDFEKANTKKWHFHPAHNGIIDSVGYAVNGTSDKRIFMHHFLFGKLQKGFVWDHKNGNGCDNQKRNLRIASSQQNSWNRRIKRKMENGKYRGTIRDRDGTWRAAINTGKKRKDLGGFKTEIEAAKAYNKAAKKEYGQFANLNSF